MNPPIPVFDICIIFCYLIFMIFIGICFYLEKNKTAEKFMDGGRSFSHWTLGISIFSTWVSNMAIISLPALAYAGNWSYFIMFISAPISGIFVVKFLIPIYRKESNISAYSYIEKRFGLLASLFCVLCYTLTNLARLGIIMYLMAISIGHLTGYEGKWVILIIGGIVVFYTFLGGLKCVIWTDFIQAIVFFIGTLFILGLIYFELPLSLQEIIAYANKHAKFNLGSPEISLLKPTLWVLAISSLIANFQGFGTEQSFVQRYMAAKNEACAKKSVIIASSLILLFSGILFFMGTLLFVYYNKESASMLTSAISREHIILQFISEQTHTGLKGIAIITIMAAAMSSISSELNSITTLFYKHIYTKFFNKNPSCKKSLKILYKSSIIIGAIPIIISFSIIQKSNLFETWNIFDSLLSGGILGLFVLAILIKTSNQNTALVGIIFGCLSSLWLTLSPSWESPILQWVKNPMDSNINIILSLLIIISTGYMAHMNLMPNIHKLIIDDQA